MTYERWSRLAEWPIAAAALVFLGVYAFLVIAEPTGATLIAIDVALLVLWAVFAVDYVMRLLLARPRGRWFVRNIPLLLMVLLPFFRSLYLLRLITVLRVLRAATGAAFRGRVAIYVSVSAVIIVVIGALGVLDAEQNAPGALITSFPDAVWWALVTITTVGYGDLYPVTGLGRTIATGMMVAGIALVGSVTATFASWFVEQAGKKPASASVGDAREGGQQAR
ncbi:voltage-gated potassium channel [Microcella putealis]|uniref:Voltage-gated potassium channel n=2 Tax=Microcella putealis TaxID=337005 RepID=A0A4Q7LXS7_9MICO|nr:potassium channel family protein [Microcella putealis]RZS59242.1 voltage-gated potassium channel [Microcella putealis]